MEKQPPTTSTLPNSVPKPDEKNFSLLLNISESDGDAANKEYTYKQLRNFIKIPKGYKRVFRRHAADKIFLSKNFLSVCLLGVTGHGKSSTANTLCGKEYFTVSEGAESQTHEVRGLVTTWQNDPEGKMMIVLDTPGFGDSKGLDTSHIANMVYKLKLIGYVHTFMLIFNSEDPRFDEQLQSTLKIFSQMFGTEYFKNVLICFTKFSTSKRAEKERERGKKPTKEKLIKDYKVWFKNIYSYSLNDVQFIFLNNGVLEEEFAEEIEKEQHRNSLKSIREFIENHHDKPFYCKDIKEVIREKDALQKKILQMSDDAEKQRQKFIEEHEKKLKELVEKERAEAAKREQQQKKEAEEREEESKREAAEKEEVLKKYAVMTEKRIRKDAAEKEREKPEEFEQLKIDNEKNNRKRDEEIQENNIHNIHYHSMVAPNFSDISQISMQKPSKINFDDDNDADDYMKIIENKCKESTSPAADKECNVPRKKNGDLDMRYKINRNQGYNKDDTLDKRYKINYKD